MIGIDREKASFLISAVGICNIVGKITMGYLCDQPWINRVYVNGICIAICGLSELEISQQRAIFYQQFMFMTLQTWF